MKTCVFCKEGPRFADEQLLGPYLNTAYAHQNCVVWSFNVFQDEEGVFQGVEKVRFCIMVYAI